MIPMKSKQRCQKKSLTCSWCVDDVALGLVCGLKTFCGFRSSILEQQYLNTVYPLYLYSVPAINSIVLLHCKPVQPTTVNVHFVLAVQHCSLVTGSIQCTILCTPELKWQLSTHGGARVLQYLIDLT